MLFEQPLIDDQREDGRHGPNRDLRVYLLGGFNVTCDGEPLDIPASTRRLVAFLAMQRRPVERPFAAGCLWLDKSECRAQANLRAALWRLRQCSDLVVATPTH